MRIPYLHWAALPFQSTGSTSAVLFWKDNTFSHSKDCIHCFWQEAKCLTQLDDKWVLNTVLGCDSLKINPNSAIVNVVLTSVKNMWKEP